jgi:hypothetical protein
MPKHEDGQEHHRRIADQVARPVRAALEQRDDGEHERDADRPRDQAEAQDGLLQHDVYLLGFDSPALRVAESPLAARHPNE